MLFKQRFWAGLADGSITLTFRRWRGPRVRAGGRYRIPGGMLHVDEVRTVEERAITGADARRAGFRDRAELLAEMPAAAGALYRVAFHFVGRDPREKLRQRTVLSAAEWETLFARLGRLDAASHSGPWTRAVLRLIERHPARRAGDLAAKLGRELLDFKRDVRKLKNLGLTESLEVGYRLSPRGRMVLDRLSGHEDGTET